MTKAFCTHCGTQFTNLEWPRHCECCGIITWKNPIPVTFVIQPIKNSTTGKIGLAIAQRAIEPYVGGWAFIGGFVDTADACLISAAAREFHEETGLELPLGPKKIVHTETNTRDNMLIAVESSEPMLDTTWALGKTCAENHQLGVLWNLDQLELCFPIHQKIATRWFNGDL